MPMTNAERILIVDDNEAGRYLKARLLAKAGYEIVEAETGKEARDRALAEHFALILLDVKLPDMNGIELCRELKREKPDLVILQTSAAFVSQQDRASGLAGGADSYLIEPLDPTELAATVEALLRRYRTEQGLREHQETLQQVIVERSEQIAKIDARLQTEIGQRGAAEEILRHAQKLDVLGQLTSGIAHDFNNVLTIIMGNLESVRRQLAKETPSLARVGTHVDNAFYGTQRAIGITRQLLAFSRRQALAPRVLDVNAYMHHLQQLLRQTLGEKNKITLELGADLWAVLCDADQMETVVLNLAVNARDAMRDGGTFTLKTENNPGTAPDHMADFVVLSITDTGSGMSPDVLKFAFEPFFTTKDVGHGTGLGLSQVHGFMRQSGGEVKIDTAVGRGTTVSLYFPRYTGDVAATGPAFAAAETGAKAARAACVLTVEDDELVRQHSVGILREMGHTVLEAANGAEALDILRSHPEVEILFTDVGLAGGTSGAELGRRARLLRPDLLTLYTTGYAPGRLLQEGLTSQDAVLVKPFTFDALSEKIAAILLPRTKVGSILMVEDEPMIRMDAAMTLRDMGFDVVEAGSVAEAMAEIETRGEGLGAVVVDMGLPDGRGDEVIARLRQKYKNTPVIITTGYEDAALHQKFHGDRCTTFLSKPYYADQVATALRGMGVST